MYRCWFSLADLFASRSMARSVFPGCALDWATSQGTDTGTPALGNSGTVTSSPVSLEHCSQNDREFGSLSPNLPTGDVFAARYISMAWRSGSSCPLPIDRVRRQPEIGHEWADPSRRSRLCAAIPGPFAVSGPATDPPSRSHRSVSGPCAGSVRAMSYEK